MAKSKKINMEISERDKKLLLVLLSLLILGAAYMFGYRKLSEEADKNKQEYSAMKVKEADLIEKQESIDDYEKNIISFENAYNGIISQYGNGVTQTFQIDFLNRLERATNVWIKSVNFQAAAQVYTFGNIQTTNPAGSGYAYSTDLAGYRNSFTVAYEGQYEDWKNFIEYLNTYFSKNVIENISMSYSDITGEVSGTMTFNVYSILGSNNTYVEPDFDVETGSDNIFMSEILGAVNMPDSTGDSILSNYDYYMSVNQVTAGIDACTIGRRGDITGESVLTGNENEPMEAALKLEGSEGNYTVTYTLLDNEYKEKCTPGNSLELLVLSSGRTSEADKSGVILTIENKSDIPVNIKVFGDDEEARVRFKQNTGDVVIY